MNVKLPMPPALDKALHDILDNLSWGMKYDYAHKRAKLIIIDGEVWWIDMKMKAKKKGEK